MNEKLIALLGDELVFPRKRQNWNGRGFVDSSIETTGVKLSANVLSGLRGPDDEKDGGSVKNRFTTPIRAWVYGKDGLNRLGFASVHGDTPELVDHKSAVRLLTMLKDARLLEEVGWHYASHVEAAVEAIVTIEGWKEEVKKEPLKVRITWERTGGGQERVVSVIADRVYESFDDMQRFFHRVNKGILG